MMQQESLKKSAQSVQDVLDAKGMACRVMEFPASTRTAQEAADAVGCEVAQIVKSLIFRTKDTGKPILVLASGVNRVNEKAIEAVIGEKIAKADADFVREVTGFAIGGVPPVGHKQALTTLIDQDLLKFKELWAAAGTPNAVFCLQASELALLTGGRVVDIIAPVT